MDIAKVIDMDRSNCPILVVDDDQLIRIFVTAALVSAGFGNIECAENGIEALEKISTFDPACVILDINMPEMDGREVLGIIRNDTKMQELPVLVVTGYDDREERNEILRAGASNLISKPIESDILIQRVSDLVERKLLIDKLSKFHKRLTSELSSAADMQVEAVPSLTDIRAVEELYDVRLASAFKPSSELGGDYWALQIIDDDRFGIMTADFSGHGISAALNTFRLNMLISRLGVCRSTPAEYLEKINTELYDAIPVGNFCAMLYAIIDVKLNTLTFSGAASPEPLFGLIKGADIIAGDGSGFPLSALLQTTYENHEYDFPKGSFLFLFSDVMTETECGENGILEIEGVMSLTKEHRNSDATVALKNILSEFFESAPDPLPDDLTAVWLSR